MNLTLRSLRDFFVSSLYTLYNNREAQAITNYYFEQKWGIAPQAFALHQGVIFPRKQVQESEKDLQRLQKGEPVQYVVGHAVFYDLTLEVNPLVLIPRPETEELVALVKQRYATHPTPCRLLDLCTGSGAIAISLAKHLPQATVNATDYSRDILQLAQRNAEANGVKVNFLQHDVLQDGATALNGPYDAIVSNPPYIPQGRKAQLHRNVTYYEPAEALFVPDDEPLLFYRHIALLAQELLNEGGQLFFETHEDFHEETEAMLQALNFKEIEKLKDINDKPRFICCKK